MTNREPGTRRLPPRPPAAAGSAACAARRRQCRAIEFTLIFPILVALFAGTVDLGQALMVSRKMNQIVSSTADVVSQNATWATSDATAMLKGMAPSSSPTRRRT